MDKSTLYQLLSAFLTQKSILSENKEMEKVIRHTTDAELGSVMSDLWDDYELKQSYDTEIKSVYKVLERRIHYKRIQMHAAHYAKYAAIFLLLVSSTLTADLLIEHNNYRNETSYFSVHVDSGKSSDVVLPDGSKVELNSQSTIVYNNDNKLSQRRVRLIGEAHFKVTKNPEKPFIVSTEFFDVVVLGTTFNVKTYKSDDIQVVSLLEGKVKLTTRHSGNNTSIYLTPNQKAIYHKRTGELSVKATDNSSETAWMKGILTFHSEPLNHIKLELERKYDVHIQMDCPSIENDPFTGSFDNKTLVEVLDNLKIHYGLNYSIDGKKVQIFPSTLPFH